MALDNAIFEALMTTIDGYLDDDLTDNFSDEQIIELQTKLEDYMANNEINTQKQLDWKSFCTDLYFYLCKGYEIAIKQGENTIGVINQNIFNYNADDDELEEFPEILQTPQIIEFPVPASYYENILSNDPEEEEEEDEDLTNYLYNDGELDW